MLLFLTLIGVISKLANGHEGGSEVLNFHGSGTTNPSKCYWAILEQFEARTKHPIRGTYRAVGSSTGIEEFVNEYNVENPIIDFASGDLPLNRTVWQTFRDADVEILHLPVLLGAVSIFHSAPVERLNLTGCLLARIFKREIVDWTDDEIVRLNPELGGRMELLPITVARRGRGSSSTDSVTNYLHKACPDHWPAEWRGPVISWNEDTVICEGSGGMTDCINEKSGTIGYIDAGHGIGAGLAEIELANEEGTVLSSEEAAAEGGIASAESGAIPGNADADFSGVSLLNRPGQYTWPIVQMTYIYVRRNLTFMPVPDEQSLLVQFLKAMYHEDYVGQCVKKYGFTLPSNETRNMALAAINSLEIDPAAEPWRFETDTLVITGADHYTISSKRERISDVERESFEATLKALTDENAVMQLELARSAKGMTDTQETQLKAALVLSSLSFVICLILACVVCRPLMNKPVQ